MQFFTTERWSDRRKMFPHIWKSGILIEYGIAMFPLWLYRYSSFQSTVQKTWMLEFTGDSEFPLCVFADELVNKSPLDHVLERCQENKS